MTVSLAQGKLHRLLANNWWVSLSKGLGQCAPTLIPMSQHLTTYMGRKADPEKLVFNTWKMLTTSIILTKLHIFKQYGLLYKKQCHGSTVLFSEETSVSRIIYALAKRINKTAVMVYIYYADVTIGQTFSHGIDRGLLVYLSFISFRLSSEIN